MANNKQRIRELKNQIILAQDVLVEILKIPVNLEETEDQKKERQTELAKSRAIVSTLRDELEHTKLNTNLSSSFEWIPSGGNRRQKKIARQMKHI